MALRLVALAVDALDPPRLARFWADVLGWSVGTPDGPVVPVDPTDGTRFRLELVGATDPKAGKNPIHLDLTTRSLDDQAASAERVVALGGEHVDVGQGPDDTHVVLADPEGNELCLIEPDNTFLAGCGRLGSITCDGSVAVGHFWSAALGWPLVWDQDEETAIQSPRGGAKITWGGPPDEPKLAKNRLHFDLAPPAGGDQRAEVERLVALGATRLDIGQGDVDWVVLADPDGNEFCVLTPR